MPLEKNGRVMSVVGLSPLEKMLSLESLVVSRDDGKTLLAKARDTVFGRMRAALGERKLTADCECSASASGACASVVRHRKNANSFPAYCRTTRQPIRQTMARASKGKTRKSTSKVKKEPAKASSSRMAAATKVKSELIDDDSSSNAVRPTAEECLYATVSLAKLHPHVVDKNEELRKTLLESCGLRDSITDSVISTMLSQNTTDKNSKQAWFQLKEAFPEWEAVCDPTNLPKVEAAIKVVGLAKTRAERIHNMLCQIREERGVPSLDYLREICDEQVKRDLSRFKGLGPKTISCVLLFAMGRPEFPVSISFAFASSVVEI